MMKSKIIFFSFMLFALSLLDVYGIDSIGVMGGIMFVGNPSDDGAPSPVLPYIGMSGSFSLSERGFIEPSFSLTANYYLWSESEEIALPAEIEYADSILLMSLILDCPYVMKYRLKEKIYYGWLASPALVLRVPLKTWGEGESQKSDILSYFYGGRFIFIETGALLEWKYSEKRSFKSRLDIMLPFYHLWDGGKFTDQLSVRLGFVFSFIKSKEAAADMSSENDSTNVSPATDQD